VSSYDFLPTLFEYLKLAPPEDERRMGRSYSHLLDGVAGDWTNEVYFEYEYIRGVRTKRWKYVERTAEWPSELFDLVNDPSEHRNLISYSQYGSTVEDLKKRLHSFFDRAGAPPLAEWRTTTKQQLAEYK
jgi:arylsulfatase A-like enzyme